MVKRPRRRDGTQARLDHALAAIRPSLLQGVRDARAKACEEIARVAAIEPRALSMVMAFHRAAAAAFYLDAVALPLTRLSLPTDDLEAALTRVMGPFLSGIAQLDEWVRFGWDTCHAPEGDLAWEALLRAEMHEPTLGWKIWAGPAPAVARDYATARRLDVGWSLQMTPPHLVNGNHLCRPAGCPLAFPDEALTANPLEFRRRYEPKAGSLPTQGEWQLLNHRLERCVIRLKDTAKPQTPPAAKEATASKAHDDGEYRPASWFPKGMAPRLRQAAAEDRKTKRVATRKIDGVVCYSVADARLWWPSDVPKEA